MKEEDLALEEEIALNQAMEKVLQDGGSVRSHRTKTKEKVSSTTTIRDNAHKTALELDHVSVQLSDIRAKSEAPECHATSICPSATCSSNANDALLSVVKRLSRPKIELQKFSGDPLQFSRFLRQFNSKVVTNTDCDDERLNYLEQFTTGEPHKIVVGMSYLGVTAYDSAWRELKTRYGDPDIVVDAFIKKALRWPIIRANDPKALDEFALFLIECHNAVKCMEAEKVLEYSENMRQLVAKLPFHLHDKWRNIVWSTRDRGEHVSFRQLVDFVRKEAMKGIDPT